MIEQILELDLSINDWFTIVGEWKRDPSFASEDTVYLHHRHKSAQLAVFDDCEIEGGIAIGFGKNSGPGGGVEERRSRGAEEHLIP